MKKVFTTLFLLGMAFCFADAQDLIVLKNAQEIEAKVEAVTQTEISYHKWSNPDGPLYTISKADVFFIKYQNGEKEVISDPTVAAAQTTTAAATASAANGAVSSKLNPLRAGRVTFDGYFNFCGYGGSAWVGPGIDVSLGVNLFDYGYIGFQTGFQGVFVINDKYSSAGWVIPIGLNMRGYLPCNGKTYPFFDWTLGTCVHNGAVFHNSMIFGCDFSRFSLGVGWDYMGGANSAVLKLGIRLGKIK